MEHASKEIGRRGFLGRSGMTMAGIGLASLAAGATPEQGAKHPAAPSWGAPDSSPDAKVLRDGSRVRPGVKGGVSNVASSHGLETVYCIVCGKHSVLVDTGFVHNFEGHLRNFETAGIDLKSIVAVFTTHIHVDHTAALAEAKERLKCPIVAHKNNVGVIESGNVAATAAEMPYIPGWMFPYQPCKVDIAVEDGDRLTVGDTTFTVVHLPGHTQGCTGYQWEDYLISGDVVFPYGALGWNDVHWGSNYGDIIDTMKRIEDLYPSHLLPTHGIPFEYTSDVSKGAIGRAQEMMKDGRTGPMGYTQRAPRAAEGREPRTIVLPGK